MAEDERHEQLLAGIVARLTWLRHTEVLRGPCELHDSPRPREAASPAALLWNWSRLLSDVQQLLSNALEPAMREPGRVHQRRVSIERGRPRGAVHWPRTTLLGLRAVDSRGLRYVCSSAERSLLAPENLLLVATLDELVARGLLLGEHERAREALGPVRLDPLRRTRAHLRAVESAPAFVAWREALRALRRSGRAVEGELEQAVRERVRGHPSAAPDWARALLELRHQPAAIPSRSALASIEPGTLWQQLAALELLCVLRKRGALRRREQGFVGAGGVVLRPISNTPAWVLAAPSREPVGVLWPPDEDWQQVRREALYWSWTAPHSDADIDRWLILHRSDGPQLTRTRGAIELRYLGVRAEGGLGLGLGPELLDWAEAG